MEIPRDSYKNWEGNTEPDLATIKTIAHHLGVPAYRILEGIIEFSDKPESAPGSDQEVYIKIKESDILKAQLSLDVLDSIFSAAFRKGKDNRLAVEDVSLGKKELRLAKQSKGKQKDISLSKGN